MAKKLSIFLSSSFDEFKNARRYLSRKISKIPYLECILQEDKGALPQDPTTTSVNDAEQCDILVGILGDCYSDTVEAEIDAAIRLKKYLLIYVKESETRNKRLNAYIEKLGKSHVVYKKFKKGPGDLYPSVLSNLQDNIYRILVLGLESFKKKQQKMIENSIKTETETKMNIKEQKYTADKILKDAKASFDNGDYLSSVVRCAISLEIALQDWLTKTKLLPKQKIVKQPIGKLLGMIQRKPVLDHYYIRNMREISMMRNQAVHEARVPSEESARIAMAWTEELLNKLGT